LTIFVGSLRRCGRSRLLLALKKSLTENSKGHFINPSWYLAVPNLDPQDTITTKKRKVKARDATQEILSMVIPQGDEGCTATFADLQSVMEFGIRCFMQNRSNQSKRDIGCHDDGNGKRRFESLQDLHGVGMLDWFETSRGICIHRQLVE
jgi:hypothetical protein